MYYIAVAQAVLVGGWITGRCWNGSGVVDGIGRSAAPRDRRLGFIAVVPWRWGRVIDVDADGVAGFVG